jgi:hypothetical protein
VGLKHFWSVSSSDTDNRHSGVLGEDTDICFHDVGYSRYGMSSKMFLADEEGKMLKKHV